MTTPREHQSYLMSLLKPDRLELILFPTEQCNFRCTYCYEDFSIGRMSPALVAGIKKLLDTRAPSLRQLELGWFGGEPLVAKDVVYAISEHAAALAADRAGLTYSGAMTTNGYLLKPEVLQRLVGAGIRSYQISLDGWADAHDATRRRADGTGTFAKIWNNLLSMQSSSFDFKALLRVHLQPGNVESVRTLVTQLSERFASDPRFDVFFKAVGNWGGPNSGSFAVLSRSEAADLVSTLQQQWRSARALTYAAPDQNPKPYVCYAARPNSLIIRADGAVGKCTVMLKDARNRIGTLRPDGGIDLRPGGLAPWIRGFRSLDESELGCPAAKLPKAETEAALLPVLAS